MIKLSQWSLGGGVYVQGYTDPDGNNVVWFPPGEYGGYDSAVLAIFAFHDEEWISPILEVESDSPEDAIRIASEFLGGTK